MKTDLKRDIMLDFSHILNKSQKPAAPFVSSASSTGSSDYANNLQANYTHAQQVSSSASANDTSKDFGLRLKGEMHYKVLQEGEVWDYNTTSDVWTTNENGNIFSLNKKDQSCTLKSGAKTTTYASDLKTKISTKIDNDSNKYNVAVIDDFDNQAIVNGNDEQEVNGTDITHGDIVRALINPNNPAATSSSNSLNFDAYDESNQCLSFTKISEYLTEIDNEVKSGKDIDAVNMSLGVATMLSDVGLSNISSLTTATGRQQAINSLLNAGDSDLVTIINQISNMSDEGISFYISAGNDYGDPSDDNPDITKGQLGVFNALTLATGTNTVSNIHSIAATATYVSENGTLVNDTTGAGYAWYSDRGGTVKTKVNGDVLFTNLGEDKNGYYKYDINGDGKADIYSLYNDTPNDTNGDGKADDVTGEYKDTETGMYEFDTNNDGYIEVFATNLDGSTQLMQGTSFAAPRAAREKLA